MRRDGYTGDIEFQEVFAYPLTIAIIIVIIGIIITFLVWVCTDSVQTIDDYNARVENFNQYSLEERQLICEFNADLSVNDDFLMSTREYPMTIRAWYSLHWQTLVYLWVIISSLVTFMGYWSEKSRKYYLCDLPLKTFYGWILLISMFIAWPILLLNWIYMQVFSKIAKKLREQRRIKREKDSAERQAIKDLADNWTTEPQLSTRFSAKAHRAYVSYVKKGMTVAQATRIKKAKSDVDSLKRKLAKAGQTVREIQGNLGIAQAELNNLESANLNSETTTKQANAEWETLTNMQGVSSVKVRKHRGNRNVDLNILVKVRVPYKAEVYDFGDYMIRLYGDYCSCKEVRSGVKRNATSTVPYYNESNGFCFGSRRDLIADYLNHGCVLEALDLMIECLHATNSEEAEEQIPNCFRKVKTIERVRRWQQIKRKILLQKEG